MKQFVKTIEERDEVHTLDEVVTMVSFNFSLQHREICPANRILNNEHKEYENETY